MRTPPLLFTYDRRFRSDGLTTHRRITINSHLNALMDRYHLEPWQVHVLSGSGTYVKECPALLRLCFDRWTIPEGATIFSDNGNSFFESGREIIPDLCGASTAHYNAAVHQYLSPNDNHHHGAAKRKWRGKWVEKRWTSKDSVESDLYLLHCLTYPAESAVQGYFAKSFQLGQETVSKRRCEALVLDATFRKRSREIFFPTAGDSMLWRSHDSDCVKERKI